MTFLKQNRTFVVLLVLALVCAVIWFAVYAQESRRSGVLTFAMLNVGQGDALFIQGPTGIQVLVDAGPNTGALLRELPKVMPFGDRSIDLGVETHPDADHVGGFVDVFERYAVGAFVTPGIGKENTLVHALHKSVDGERIPIYVAHRGMLIDIGGGARLKVLYPDIDVSGWGNRANDGSIVMRLVYGETEVLLTGDVGVDEERRLLVLASSTLQSDVLKVGHHGSRHSTSEAFLQAVQPTLALISVGAKNTYGHPAGEVVTRLEEAGSAILRTDRDDTIICTSNAVIFSCN